MTRALLYWNHAFAILIKEQPLCTWPLHDKHDRNTIFLEESRGEISFHCSLTQPLQWLVMKIITIWLVVRFLGKRYFLCRVSTRPNQIRQALVSAVCYGSLTYTRWKGSMLLNHIWRNKGQNEKNQKWVWMLSLLEKGFLSPQFSVWSFWPYKPS